MICDPFTCPTVSIHCFAVMDVVGFVFLVPFHSTRSTRSNERMRMQMTPMSHCCLRIFVSLLLMILVMKICFAHADIRLMIGHEMIILFISSHNWRRWDRGLFLPQHFQGTIVKNSVWFYFIEWSNFDILNHCRNHSLSPFTPMMR